MGGPEAELIPKSEIEKTPLGHWDSFSNYKLICVIYTC